MMAFVSIVVFTGALALSVGIIVATVAPQWQRIVRLASGRGEPGFAPLAQLASAERRIAVRRWASAPVPVMPWQPRAAA